MTRTPISWLENFNLSFLQFIMLPTNPWTGHWSPPPAAVFIDAPVSDAILVAEQILDSSFFRLNPGIMLMDPVAASMVAAFPQGHQWLIGQICNAVHTLASETAVRTAAKFLKSGWFHPRGSGADSGTP